MYFYHWQIWTQSCLKHILALKKKIKIMRPSKYIKTSVRVDYAPDVCKDFKETGFCTFGDSCKFLHDRGDYKHGWEIERDSNDQTTKDSDDKYVIKNDEEKDSTPTECPICEKEFTNPVITNCKHFFCQSCAINNFRKSKKCFTCGENTNGIFKNADKILKSKVVKKNGDEEDEFSEEDDE
uniref:RING finger protein 113 homolog (inferred by orthology to a C. elegans protein) n=1 Tax=Strongyloides venezuelensis TaxID=75913 RepID=A0A0K0F961_STRVS